MFLRLLGIAAFTIFAAYFGFDYIAGYIKLAIVSSIISILAFIAMYKYLQGDWK